MKWLGYGLLIVVLWWWFGSSRPQDTHARCQSLECQLATIHEGYPVEANHVAVTRSRLLLDQIAGKVRNSRQEIADMSVTTQQLLREQGHRMTLLEVMDDLNRSLPASASSLKLNFADVGAVYVTLKGTKR